MEESVYEILTKWEILSGKRKDQHVFESLEFTKENKLFPYRMGCRFFTIFIFEGVLVL